MTDFHHEDHKHLLDHMQVNEQVATLDKDISLIKEKLKDEKEDRERLRSEEKADKASSQRILMWGSGLIFSIVMASAGFGIQSNATIQVLQEKVKEQKTEIEKLTIYVGNVDAGAAANLSEVTDGVYEEISKLEEKLDDHKNNHQ